MTTTIDTRPVLAKLSDGTLLHSGDEVYHNNYRRFVVALDHGRSVGDVPYVDCRFPDGTTAGCDVANLRMARPCTPPNTPPFQPGQRVRHAGKMLQVSHCERRTDCNRVRWVVESLDGVQAFADQCELVPEAITNATPVKTTVGEAIDVVMQLATMREALQRVQNGIADETLVAGPGNGKGEHYAIGIAASVALALQLPEKSALPLPLPVNRRRVSGVDQDGRVTTIIEPAENPQPAPVRYACSKVAKVGDRVKIVAPSDGRLCEVLFLNGCRILLKPLNGDPRLEVPANQVEFMPEAVANLPETPDSSAVAVELQRHLDESRERLGMALKLLGQSDSRLFFVSGLEVRHKDGKWRLFHPGLGKFTADEFADPVSAALRAVELSEAAKGGAA